MKMNRKEQLLMLIKDKLAGRIRMSYQEIADVTEYHPKYVLRFKKAFLNNQISLVHGNKDRKPALAISREEEEKIVNLYKRSNASIRKFTMFYSKRSYSCIYNVLKRNNLI